MTNTYYPKHSENRMKGEGDVETAMDFYYPDESVDVIICSRIVHHVMNPAYFLDNVEKN